MKIRQISRQYNNNVEVHEDLYKLTRANITFGNMTQGDEGQNIAGSPVGVVTPSTPDTEFTVVHNLNKVPTGYLVLNKNKAGDFYDSSTPWTNTKIFLKCTTASVSAQLFVLG